ncbi:hypothetical protein L1887_47091 [Cichorium endivia]|nr:hypothetical protein L1887_47091 [Cichorium endivia]
MHSKLAAGGCSLETLLWRHTESKMSAKVWMQALHGRRPSVLPRSCGDRVQPCLFRARGIWARKSGRRIGIKPNNSVSPGSSLEIPDFKIWTASESHVIVCQSSAEVGAAAASQPGSLASVPANEIVSDSSVVGFAVPAASVLLLLVVSSGWPPV